MKKIEWLILIFFFTFSNIPFAQWELRNNGISVPHQAGRAIDSADSSFAVAAYRNDVYKTENTGMDWVNITPPNESGFVDVSVIGHSLIWLCTENGKILATTDGGSNWSVQFFDNSKTDFMNYIKMFDLNNGIAMGDAPASDKPVLFLKTTNGGVNWLPVESDSLKGTFSSNLWLKVDFPDTENGYYSPYGGLGFRYTYKTIDGGQSWYSTNHCETPELIKFYDKDIGFGISYIGVKGIGVIRTFDGLISVDTVIISNSTWSPSDIEFFPGNPSKVFYLDYAHLFFSSDSGKAWSAVSDSSKFLLARDIVLTDKDHGWLLCDTGNVYYSQNINNITSVKNEKTEVPKNFILLQNYPNPFNPDTKISFSTNEETLVTLKVFDVLGREIETLVNESKPAGSYEVRFDGSFLPSGIYIYKIDAGQFSNAKKMLLTK